MKKQELLRRLEGIQTIESVMDILGVSRGMAIYYLYRLRKAGYVKTRRQSNNRRVYTISVENKLGGTSYYDIINRSSPSKIATPTIHRIYGKEPSGEETLLYAIQTKSPRTILASLSLFMRISDWQELYARAKESKLERQVGALYDLARKVMKVRRMSARFRNRALPRKGQRYDEMVPGLSSKDFGDIEQVWKVRLPFNRKDLEVYR